MSNSIIPPDALDKIARRYGLGKYAGTKPAVRDNHPGVVSQGVSHNDDWFTFENLELSPGQNETIKLNTSLFPGQSQNQQWWWTLAQSNPAAGVPYNGVILYQMAHRIFTLRDDRAYQKEVSELQNLLQEDWQTEYPHTGTKLTYGTNLETTIEHLQLDGTIISTQVNVPEFTVYATNDNWSYLVLAKEQPESELGTVETIPSEAIPLLETLLGAHYEEAGAVFQHLSTRKNGNLREVKLWVPSTKARPCQRALVLGVGNYDGFNISTLDDITNAGPARGVVAQKISGESGGRR